MVIEVATFKIIPGREDEFAKAYAGARHLVEVTDGCGNIRMSRGIESPSTFILIIEWDSVEAHVDGFRASERFDEWRAAISPYFATPPEVEHYADV